MLVVIPTCFTFSVLLFFEVTVLYQSGCLEYNARVLILVLGSRLFRPDQSPPGVILTLTPDHQPRKYKSPIHFTSKQPQNTMLRNQQSFLTTYYLHRTITPTPPPCNMKSPTNQTRQKAQQPKQTRQRETEKTHPLISRYRYRYLWKKKNLKTSGPTR